ncbi:GNAT family N-acetyltransferase [Tengunoibacter tsumagoiensis]|uniref:N-acetyltransferase n=1 Tax=Tengunoibacter tsumagoiensis TaxID=2014871 RepID=A0A402A9H4_9CHLR|nr:GNAT family N-acetyltransferase [Tengunoibacter tsumagoiensis]GCE15834.1 N-acetyltransferase [Tengunoibacter tsumagoiensis]
MSSSTYKIVQASLEHISVLVPLFDGYRQFYGQASDLAGAERFLADHFKRKSSVVFLALGEDQKGLGFTQLYPSYSSVSMRQLWILNDLFVAADARRSGIGRALLERAREFALETQAKGLTLNTAVTNTRAQSVYESAGWQRETEFYAYNLYL